MATKLAPLDAAAAGARISDEYIDRVTKSAALRGSSSLPRLLRYLAERARDEPGENIKEFRIATEALGRGQDFDSRTDSVVRVTTARLRTKLDEYYAREGASDPIRLHVPKGAYRLVALPPPPRDAAAPKPARKGRATWAPRAAVAAGGVLALALAFGLGRSWQSPRYESSPELARLWNELAGPDRAVRVVYSNVAHGVTSSGRVVNSGDVEAAADEEWHTGVGELEAALRLAQMADRFEFDLAVKRALLVDWDEVVDDNVVYLGGPGANPQVAELGAAADFVFEQHPDGEAEQFVIRDRGPRPGEPAAYESSTPLDVDYAIVRLTRGFRSDRWILLLAGITTFGTAAAAETVCDPAMLEQARNELGLSIDDPLGPFECVLEVGIKDSIVFDRRIRACRPIEPARPSP